MNKKIYSAGAVKVSFWFSEFKKEVTLLSHGNNFEQIKQMNKSQNIFGAPTITRAEQIYNSVTARIKSLDSSFYSVFLNSDLDSQKLFVLISIMAYDTLFFEFVYEVIREKIKLGTKELFDRDIEAFFENKKQQNTKVSMWTEQTLVRLGRCYKTLLYEAGIINKSSKEPRKISKAIFNSDIKNWLEENNLSIMIEALTGEKR